MPERILSILFLLIWGNLHAQIQPPTFEWAKSFGGWNDDYLLDMGVDDAGNVYVCGEFKGFMCFDTICIFSQLEDTSDIFLEKYDSLGNVVWAKAFGGRWTDEDAEIEVSPAGDIYLSGKFSDSIQIGTEVLHANDPNFYFYGAPDCFIAKLNTDGEVQWVIHPGTSHVFDIKLQNDELYVSGTLSVSFLEFGESRVWRNSNKEDTYLVKLDANGQVIWSKTFGIIGDKSALISSIAVSEDEKIFISGRSIDTLLIDNLVITYNSEELEFIVGLDEAGTALWGEYFVMGSSHSFSISGLNVVDKNTVVALGRLRGNIILKDTIYRYEGRTYFNLGINFNGESEWFHTNPGRLSVTQSTVLNNQLYVCGTLFSNINLGDTSLTVNELGFGDVVILRYDSTGQLVWGKALSSPAEDDGLGICVNSKGNLYVAGGFFDFDTLIDSLVVSNSWGGSFEPWVGRMSKDSFYIPPPPLPNPISPIWQVFPNPFMDSLYVSGKFKPPLQLTLLDIQGRLIWESSIQPPISPTRIPISVPELSPALYILVLKTKDQRVAYKLLKQP
jgi:hypothetical protein